MGEKAGDEGFAAGLSSGFFAGAGATAFIFTGSTLANLTLSGFGRDGLSATISTSERDIHKEQTSGGAILTHSVKSPRTVTFLSGAS